MHMQGLQDVAVVKFVLALLQHAVIGHTKPGATPDTRTPNLKP